MFKSKKQKEQEKRKFDKQFEKLSDINKIRYNVQQGISISLSNSFNISILFLFIFNVFILFVAAFYSHLWQISYLNWIARAVMVGLLLTISIPYFKDMKVREQKRKEFLEKYSNTKNKGGKK